MLGLLEQSSVGVFGGAFLGLVTGLFSGICGAVYAAVFNLLAPLTGGIAIRLEPLPEGKETDVNTSPLSEPPVALSVPVSSNLDSSRDLQPPS